VSQPADDPTAGETAFVLGGGGLLGAVEVGMLRALLEAGVRPDLVLGTSVGALNGALVAADPGPGVVDRMAGLWESAVASRDVYGDGPVRQVSRAVRTGTHLHSSEPLRNRLAAELGDLSFAELAVPFQCCAASIERAAEHWFTSGRVVDAVMASAAVPGLLRPAEVDGEHYLDGGIVNSIPVGRAVECGASRIFVLHVGRVDRPLTAPRRPWEVARVSFEIARRHRFHREMAALPGHVTAHVLPTGGGSAKDDSLLAYRDFGAVVRRIDAAYDASAAYLDEHLGGGPSAASPGGHP
jgi:NTE family protein